MLPAYFFSGPLPDITNSELKNAVDYVKHAWSKEEALERAFNLVTERFQGSRFKTYLLIWKAFAVDPNKLWNRSGFMHCTHQNFLLKVLLLKSGWFGEKEIRYGYSLVWDSSPHQYLKILMDGREIAVDPWNRHFGVPFGHYAAGFGYKSLN